MTKHRPSPLICIAALGLTVIATTVAQPRPIDREALVRRHHPVNTSFDPLSPFTVGNGGFAITVDATGLQSFPEAYSDGIPLSTQSDWGWHSFPDEHGYRLEDTLEDFATGDRMVPYPTRQTTPAGSWLRSNPHRLGLGHIGFEFRREDGRVADERDISAVEQELDLWNGEIRSSFRMQGVPVDVVTAVTPHHDNVVVRIRSRLIDDERLRIALRFPYGNGDWGIVPEDWEQPRRHQTYLSGTTRTTALIERELDDTRYSVFVTAGTVADIDQPDRHRVTVTPQAWGRDEGEVWHEFTFHFREDGPTHWTQPEHENIADHWNRFWADGAAVDFSGSRDSRAHELERRVVLSQYLTAVQCAGDMPPQETGLTFNSWYGVAHLEMHWWHGVHFALWNRLPLLERSLPWYEKILPTARGIAARQGYPGARWPKMVDREGLEKPSGIAPLLVWQQPHPIYFAELIWRQQPTDRTLLTYASLVEETAAFMAGFVRWNKRAGHYDLGPPLIPAQESYDPRTTRNPPYELAYWRWGLEVAQKWRERRGLARHAQWDELLAQLSPYPEYQDAYATAEGVWNMVDHPSVLGAFGMLPGAGIDQARMRRTLERVMVEQDWDHTWGWDYPLIALTAARLGETELAVDALLLDRPKNTYLNNGHNWQDDRLRIYLPGNGALLTAVAMMAAGWDEAPDRPAPGFPDDGSWVVRAEGFHRYP